MKIYQIKNFLDYPSDKNWYNFSNGSNVGDDQINHWMQDCFEILRDQILSGKSEKPSTYIRSGNTAVIAFAFMDENSNYTIDFIVTKNYIHGEIYDWDPIEEVEFEKIK
jgi:hypothetical protein